MMYLYASCFAAVGKSALLTRFSENVFLQSYTSTIGIDFNSRMIRVGGSICKLEIWDTAGQVLTDRQSDTKSGDGCKPDV
jgi:small GTP-binding protein